MTYRVVPFQAKITEKGGAGDVATQLQSTIASETASGWEYLRLERVETFVAGTMGCFGLGARPGHFASYHVAVFRKA